MSRNFFLFYIFLSTVFLSTGYSQNLHFQWARQYGSENTSNQLKSLVSDNANHVFAFTDFEHEFTINGNTYVSEGESDLLFYSIDEDGNIDWVVHEGGIGKEIAQQIKCDIDGNIYLMGKFVNTLTINGVSYESNGTFDMFLAKYSNNGDFEWCKTFGGPNSESLVSIFIQYGVITVAGRFYDYTVIEEDTLVSQSGTDILLAKFNTDGDLLNTHTIGGESVDMVSSMDFDVYGNIYITGDFYQTISFGDDTFDAGDMLGIYIAKYDPSFNLQWAYQIDGDDLKPGVKIGVSSEGECTVSGSYSSNLHFGSTSLNTTVSDEDIFLANFSTEGEVNWAQRFHSNSAESVFDLKVDRLGGIYMTGYYLTSITFGSYTVSYTLC